MDERVVDLSEDDHDSNDELENDRVIHQIKTRTKATPNQVTVGKVDKLDAKTKKKKGQKSVAKN